MTVPMRVSEDNKINVGQIGAGYWGPNLIRNLLAIPSVRLMAIADLDPLKFVQLGVGAVGLRLTTDYQDILKDPEIDAVVIATPAATHGVLIREAIKAGKHVLVEKPLATSSAECKDLIDLAEQSGKVLMVGHTFLYNAAVRQIKKYVDGNELGQVYYLYSQRLNLGRVRSDVNALWNFGPHDVSIILYLLGDVPVEVSARGYSYLNADVEDLVFMSLVFPNGICAHIHVSWLDPQKLRRMTVVGSKKMVVYDDVSIDAKVMLYDRKVEKIPTSSSPRDFQDFAEFQHVVKSGDVVIPSIRFPEPLKVECEHFIECIIRGDRPLTDGRHGFDVVRILEAAQRSMENRGLPQELKRHGDR